MQDCQYVLSDLLPVWNLLVQGPELANVIILVFERQHCFPRKVCNMIPLFSQKHTKEGRVRTHCTDKICLALPKISGDKICLCQFFNLSSVGGRSRENFPIDWIFLNFYCKQIMSYLYQRWKKIGPHCVLVWDQRQRQPEIRLRSQARINETNCFVLLLFSPFWQGGITVL